MRPFWGGESWWWWESYLACWVSEELLEPSSGGQT
jgi:hypothetical protein